MMTKLMLDICEYDQCLCWLPADNVIPCIVTSMLPFGKTQMRKIALLRRSVAVGLRDEHSSDGVRMVAFLPERKRQFATSRMPELGPYGSVRGARGNSRPYRESHRLRANR